MWSKRERRHRPFGLVGLVLVLLLCLASCGEKTFWCDVYMYNPPYGYSSYVGTYDYSGRSASDAQDNCNDDWSNYYQCRNCKEN
ncbi:MAG: hypothetical protein EA403_00135 [Spirochaetaceae bacterium]|nr:MAG: hypothetical protein EA403_00135 [Spirochaetaceae bacterium]